MPEHAPIIEVQPPRRAGGNVASPSAAARLPAFIAGPADAAAKLGALKVLTIGVGSVGGRVVLHLARLGLASLWLIDPKRFKAESILTHDIDPRSVGKFKAQVTARRCKAISPATRVFAGRVRVEDLPVDAFADADLVVLATDNLAAEIEVGRRCVRFGKPLVQAAVHGDTLTVQVRVFGNADQQSPCPACGFGEGEWRMLNDQVRFSCDGSGAALVQGALPTMSVSSLCSLAADLAVNQVLRVALALGESVLDTCLEYCGYTNRSVSSRLVRNARCPAEHARWRIAPEIKFLSACSPADLSRVAGFDPASASTAFAVEGFNWVESGMCRCALPQAVRCFVPEARQRAGRCSQCRSSIRVQPIFEHQVVSAALLGAAAGQPLANLGAAAARCVWLSNGDESVLFRAPHDQRLP